MEQNEWKSLIDNNKIEKKFKSTKLLLMENTIEWWGFGLKKVQTRVAVHIFVCVECADLGKRPKFSSLRIVKSWKACCTLTPMLNGKSLSSMFELKWKSSIGFLKKLSLLPSLSRCENGSYESLAFSLLPNWCIELKMPKKSDFWSDAELIFSFCLAKIADLKPNNESGSACFWFLLFRFRLGSKKKKK